MRHGFTASGILCAVVGLGACGDDGGANQNANLNNDTSAVCGDGRVEGAEVCDEGAGNSDLAPDGCRTDCTPARCGDGVVDPGRGEVCDDGPQNGDLIPDGCRTDCTPARCGDGVVDPGRGEICDCGESAAAAPARCGGRANGDPEGTCTPGCVSVYCGNGAVEADHGETCDDGNNLAGDGCGPTCLVERCGNGFVDPGEECDDGGVAAGDGCGPTCLVERCGNGIVDPGEACDASDFRSGDGCSADCRSLEVCGNGYVDFAVGETCDDGDGRSHDGCSSGCRAEAWTWRTLAAATPPLRVYPGLAHDAARGVTILFGGGAGGNPDAMLGDTWVLEGGYWQELPVTAPARSGHAMTWDARLRRVVMHGGYGDSGTTWVFDGSRWQQLVGNPAPRARALGAAAYDAGRGRVVLFGGSILGNMANDWFDDTWELDGEAWTEVAVAATPGRRIGHAMAYDPIRGRVVLFGGVSRSTGWSDETWEWDGITWTPVPTDAAPAPRTDAAMTFDSRRGRLILAGGRDEGQVFDDAWELGPTGWTILDLSVRPQPRSGARMVHDPVAGVDLLFGGADVGGGGVADTWRLSESGWDPLDPAPVTPPSRVRMAFATDDRRGRVVVTGGEIFPDPGTVADTWSWNGVAWTELDPTGGPGSGSHAAMAYDPVADAMVLLKGQPDGVTVGETWELQGEAWVPMPAVTPGPVARSRAGMTFHAGIGRVVLLGGRGCPGWYCGDVWTYAGDGVWEAGPAGPSARQDPAVAFDPVLGVLVVLGGLDDSGLRNDTWTFDGATWVEVAVTAAPPADGQDWTAIWNPAVQRVMAWGGGNAVWLFEGDGWREEVVPGGPPERRDFALALDPLHHGLLIFSGGELFPEYHRVATSHRLRPEGPGAAEGCAAGLDADEDGLRGCDDPDCGAWCARCGDGTCDPLESGRICPGDCGAPPVRCGDLHCDPGEDTASCPGDCPAP